VCRGLEPLSSSAWCKWPYRESPPQGTLLGAVGDSALKTWPVLAPLPTYGRDRDGAKRSRYRALIFANRSRHIAIRGRGSIDGQGAWWWDRRPRLRVGRPHLIEFFNCSHVEVSGGLTLRNSAFWTVHPVYSTHVHIHGIAIRAPLYAPNTDGIDPDSSRHVLIERCDIAVGDDHIAIKAGMNEVARESFPRFVTENVTVRFNTLRGGMGIAVGSETAGGIRDVFVHQNELLCEGWSVALHLKSAPQRGGVVERVHFHGNAARNCTALMRLDIFGRARAPRGYPPTAIRSVSWVSNEHRDVEVRSRRLRSKFICPGVCDGMRVVNNSLAPTATWQCQEVRSLIAHGNQPAGLAEACRRHKAKSRRKSKSKGGAAQRGRSTNGPTRWRKFDWRTQSVSWTT